MRFLSLFSGIEAASVAWEPLGWEAVAFSDIDKFSCQFLAHKYPDVPNLGDVTQITESQIASLGPIDVVVFGSPCQDLSVAGKRKGLIDGAGNITRSGLFFSAINIFHWAHKHCGARFAVWENVPGAFSSGKGADFAAVVSFMAGIDDVEPPKTGWGTEGVALGDNGLLEWATLDAQWFGVAQRRRRVFAVLDTGDWTSRPPILLEPHGLRGDSAPSREAREKIASFTPSGFGNYSEGIGTLRTNGGDLGGGSETLCIPINTMTMMGRPSDDLNPRMGLGIGEDGEPSPTLTKAHSHAVAYNITFCDANGRRKDRPNGGLYVNETEVTSTLTNAGVGTNVLHQMAVRKLTPLECERLQGFPDNYTNIPNSSDTNRYKALGNSMAVPVMRWIGEQIDTAKLFD